MTPWISIDTAKGASGVALWHGAHLVDTCVLRPMGSAGKFARWTNANTRKAETYATRAAAWQSLIRAHRAQLVVLEKAWVGMRPSAGLAGSWAVGGIEHVCQLQAPPVPTMLVVPATWRKVAKEAFGVSWPPGDRKKQLAVELVKLHWRRVCSEDEAEAVLCGFFRIRTDARLAAAWAAGGRP